MRYATLVLQAIGEIDVNVGLMLICTPKFPGKHLVNFFRFCTKIGGTNVGFTFATFKSKK